MRHQVRKKECAVHEAEGRGSSDGEEAKPVGEGAAREGDGVPVVFAGEVVAVERDNEEIVEFVPDRTAEGFHERGKGSKEEREDGFDEAP